MVRAANRMLILVLGLTSCGLAGIGQAQEIGNTVVVDEAIHNDLYVAGQEVDIQAAVTGDVVAAGRSVVISGDVSEDIIAAGRTVTVSGQVADDARLAGGMVTLTGTVAGHAVMAGRETRIEAGGRIGEWAWITGGRIYIAGNIGGELKARGRSVELTGQVEGDVELGGRDIRVGDGAVINGNLTWRGYDEPVISDSAVITGEVIKGPPLRDHRHRRGFFYRVFMMLSVIVAAGVLYTLFRSRCNACATMLRSRPWASLVTGLAVFVTMPVVIALLFISGIGALLGVVIMLAFGLALILGGLTGVTSIAVLGAAWFKGDAAGRLWAAWLAIAIVAVVMGLLYIVRPVGALVATVVMLFGLGALSLETYRGAADNSKNLTGAGF